MNFNLIFQFLFGFQSIHVEVLILLLIQMTINNVCGFYRIQLTFCFYFDLKFLFNYIPEYLNNRKFDGILSISLKISR